LEDSNDEKGRYELPRAMDEKTSREVLKNYAS